MKHTAMSVLIVLLMLASCIRADARVTRDTGPDLPYSCDVIRLGAAMRGFKNPPTKTDRVQIRALEKEHGITPKQHRQAVACFKK